MIHAKTNKQKHPRNGWWSAVCDGIVKFFLRRKEKKTGSRVDVHSSQERCIMCVMPTVRRLSPVWQHPVNTATKRLRPVWWQVPARFSASDTQGLSQQIGPQTAHQANQPTAAYIYQWQSYWHLSSMNPLLTSHCSLVGGCLLLMSGGVPLRGCWLAAVNKLQEWEACRQDLRHIANTHTHTYCPYWSTVFDSQGEVLLEVAAVPQEPRPQLHTDDAEDEEDEEAEQQHVAQHGKSVQQQVHQDTHTCGFQSITDYHWLTLMRRNVKHLRMDCFVTQPLLLMECCMCPWQIMIIYFSLWVVKTNLYWATLTFLS